MRHTNRHARAPHRATGWGSSAAVLSAALLVVGLAGPAAPADAAPEDPASSTEQAQDVAEQTAPDAESAGERASAEQQGDGADQPETNAAATEPVEAGVAENPTGEATGDDADGVEQPTSQNQSEPAEEGGDAEPVLSVLTIEVTDASGAAVPGVGFELWQETDDSAGLQRAADSNTDAGCTTAADGTCTAGEDDSGAPRLGAGTYYWVQTQTPDGFQAPATDGEPAGTATITEAEAGTDLAATEVTLTATEDSDDEAAGGTAGDEAREDSEDAAAGTAARTNGSDQAAGRSSEDEVMTPMSVPNPGANAGTAVINVNVGGVRTGTASDAVSSLAGVTLHLYNGNGDGPTTAVDEDWAECVSDNDGDCSFTIPDTQPEVGHDGACIRSFLGWCLEYEWIVDTPGGDNYDRQFWVVQESASAGWYANTELVVGQTSHSASDYEFRTGSQLRAGQIYRSGNDFMSSSSNQTSSGIWQNSLDNPQLPQTCSDGLNVALVLDLSGSMDPYLSNLKTSAKGFVDALAGTNSSVALFTFAENAPRASGSSGQNYSLMSIDSGNNRQTINSRIDAYRSGGGTNWDSGLYQVAQSGTDFDLAVVVTDGNATYYRNGNSVGGNGSTTRFVESEYAVFAANAIKAEDTRVLAVGVGDGISGSPANLAAISGPTPYIAGSAAKDADYFQSSWQQLASLLSEIAKGATCQATVDVTKFTQTYGSTTWDPAQGWAFDASQQTGVSTFSSIGDGSTGSAGTVEFTVQFDTMDATTTLQLTEQPSAAQQDLGWELVADLVQCTVNGTTVDATVDAAGLSLTVEDIGVNDHVSCDFYNRQVLTPGLQVVKHGWASASHETEIASGSPVSSGTTVYWTYLVTNTGETALDHITVTDDQVGTATCPTTTLAPGQHMTCTASGPVTALP